MLSSTTPKVKPLGMLPVCPMTPDVLPEAVSGPVASTLLSTRDGGQDDGIKKKIVKQTPSH